MGAKARRKRLEPKTLDQQVAELRDEVYEIREMLARLLARQSCKWEDRPPRASLFANHEDRIPMEDAVSIFWGKSAAKDTESLDIHADFLRQWATVGINGVLLETEIIGGKWYTSRKAVQRFQQKIRINKI